MQIKAAIEVQNNGTFITFLRLQPFDFCNITQGSLLEVEEEEGGRWLKLGMCTWRLAWSFGLLREDESGFWLRVEKQVVVSRCGLFGPTS